jgi:nucleoside-triphosphatase
LIVRARRHSSVAASRSAAAAAPRKFGIRPRAPGKREARAFSSADQTSSRMCCLSVSIRGVAMAKHSALLLTGVPGIGKTTVIRRVADALGDDGRQLRGFVTEEIRKGRERMGFRIETFDGETAVLAHVSIRSEHRVSRYGVDVAALDRIVVKALALSSRVDVYLVDEIGKMECLSVKFVAAVEKLFQGKRPVVATVALRGGGFIERVKRLSGVELRTITRSNRDEMSTQVIGWIAARASR